MTFRASIGAGILAISSLSLCNGQSVSGSRDTTERITQLDEVIITGRRLTERKYGIKKKGVVRFSDGMFDKNENFEIGQVVKLGKSLTQITSLNLYITADRPDTAIFRINFYRYDPESELPGQRINNSVIQGTRAVKHGWLTFDLSTYDIVARGEVLAAVEFVADGAARQKILYDVKIGGTSRSYYRLGPAEQWMRPPHHYCLYVTAITDELITPEEDDPDTPPTFVLKSDYSAEPISLFVRLPRNYSRTNARFPVVYLLDGNAYFDAVARTADLYIRKKKILVDPIIVGLGYDNAYIMDSLRNRDYTFPEAIDRDSFKISGLGNKYYDFIGSKIKPLIDSTYRTDDSDQTIMGHSLGGYFAFYAFSRNLERPLFKNFVAASPSLYYKDNWIVTRLAGQVADGVDVTTGKLIVTIGEYEKTGSSSDIFDKLVRTLRNSGVPVESITYAKTEHMGTAVATFERALISLFGSRKD